MVDLPPLPDGTVRAHLENRTSVVDREVNRYARRHHLNARRVRALLVEQVRTALLETPPLESSE